MASLDNSIFSNNQIPERIMNIMSDDYRNLLGAVRIYNDVSPLEMAEMIGITVGEYTFLEESIIRNDTTLKMLSEKLGIPMWAFTHKLAFESIRHIRDEYDEYDDEELADEEEIAEEE